MRIEKLHLDRAIPASSTELTHVLVHWQRCLQGFAIPAVISTSRPVPGRPCRLAEQPFNDSIHYNKVYNTKQYEKYGTIVVNIVPYNTYCTIRKMTLQYNIQYKSILYRINVQYGTILCTIQLYNTVQFYVQYSCTLK